MLKIGPVVCEWCKTPLENVKTLRPNEDDQYSGYCPHCKTMVWSDPVKPTGVEPAIEAVGKNQEG